MSPIEITDTAIHFRGGGGLLLLLGGLAIVIYLFRSFMHLMAGRHRDDWVIQVLIWGGAIGIICSAFGLTGCAAAMSMICINTQKQLVILWTPDNVERMELESQTQTEAMHRQLEQEYQLLYGWPELGEFVYQVREVTK